MLYPDKVSVLNWPDKTLVKEILINMTEIFERSSTSNTFFSDDGRYLFIKSGNSIKIYDLLENSSKEINIPNVGRDFALGTTTDGKYLLINPEEPKTTTIYYHQVY